jgi:hypothetical protein
MFYERTPTEELRIASAYLDTAEESFNQAITHLEALQDKWIAHQALLLQARTRIAILQKFITKIETQVILPADQTDQPGL